MFRELSIPQDGILIYPELHHNNNTSSNHTASAFIKFEAQQDIITALNRAALLSINASESSLEELCTFHLTTLAGASFEAENKGKNAFKVGTCKFSSVQSNGMEILSHKQDLKKIRSLSGHQKMIHSNVSDLRPSTVPDVRLRSRIQCEK